MLTDIYGIRCDVFLIQRRVADTYVMKAQKGKYIFKVYRHGWRTKSEVSYELRAPGTFAKY